MKVVRTPDRHVEQSLTPTADRKTSRIHDDACVTSVCDIGDSASSDIVQYL